MNNAQQRRKSIKYAQIITRATRFTNILIYNQIYLIYNNLDLEFRRNLSLSIEAIDINFFLNKIKIKKKI